MNNSKRLLAAAIHKKINIYEIANPSNTPVRGHNCFQEYPTDYARLRFWKGILIMFRLSVSISMESGLLLAAKMEQSKSGT